MNIETLLWVGGLAIEVLAVVAIVLIVLLRKSQKARRQLLAQLEARPQPVAEVVAVAAPVPEPVAVPEPAVVAEPEPVPAPVAEPIPDKPVATTIEIAGNDWIDGEEEVAPAVPTEAPGAAQLDQLQQIVDDAKLDESAERLQQQLDVTKESLERLEVDLQQEPNVGEEPHAAIATLKDNLQEMSSEVDNLQESSAQLRRDLHDKTVEIQQNFAEQHEKTERELHHAQKLRRDMMALREKLRLSENDKQSLQSQKERLTTEYEALNKEYERVYANAAKK